MVRLVIFDLDETLMRLPVDWNVVKKEISNYGKRNGITFDENAHIISLSSAISNTPQRKSQVDAIWRRHELSAINTKGVERYPASEEFVKSLYKKGIELAVASNNCHATIEKALELARIKKYFGIVVGRDDVPKTKPAPDMLLKIVQKAKVKKTDIVFYGDSENDMLAAKAAGIKFISVKSAGSRI